MANQPTIVVANLDDAKLKASIDKMVNDLNAGLNKMTADTDAAVAKMQASLKSVGNIKFGSGGSDGGSSKRTKKQHEEAEAVKQAADAYDKLAQSQQKASKKKGIEYISLPSDVQESLTYLINVNKNVDTQLDSILQKEQAIIAAKEKEAQVSREVAAAQSQQVGVSGSSLGWGDVHQMTANSRKILEQGNAIKEQSVSYSALEKTISQYLGVSEQELQLEIRKNGSYAALSASLKKMVAAYQEMTQSERESSAGRELVNNIQRVQRAVQQTQAQMSRPTSLKAALGLDQKSLDDIAYKMQMLRNYRSSLDFRTIKGREEIEQVNKALEKLRLEQNRILGQNKDMMSANNALTRSFNYMKNRLAFYFTVGASTQFIKNLIEIRSQYEMNERALGILINSAERGSQIFKELSEMALVSPYTLIELSAAAKQLTAYDVAAKDVVDTTRRLADMASAVGVPIERLTYALGQIKAYGYLNSRDARMFANAGIPLVKQLSDYYTELEGKMVSTADVYDRMKKKAIDYNSVMSVITKMTDDGGKFFNFQAKMADTLKVRLANLTLAWNNMMNEIGSSNQGILTTTIGLLKEMFKRWKDIDSAIHVVMWTVGFAKLAQIIQIATIGVGALGKQIAWNVIVGKKLSAVIFGLVRGFKSLVASPATWFALVAMAATSATLAIVNMNDAQKELNKSLREGAKEEHENLSRFLKEREDIRNSLSKKVVGADGKESVIPQNIEQGEARKVWESIREQIELTTDSNEAYITSLLRIENISERVRRGFDILDSIKAVDAAVKELDDDTIKIDNDWSDWWNLFMLPDGWKDNLVQYEEELNNVKNKWGDVDKAIAKWKSNKFGDAKLNEDIVDMNFELARLRENLDTTMSSIIKFIEGKGWNGDTAKINEVFNKIGKNITLDAGLTPEQGFLFQMEWERGRAQAAKRSLEIRIADENKALAAAADASSKLEVESRLKALKEEYANFEANNGRGKVLWENYTKWMKEQHMSEMREMFRGMSAEEIKKINFGEKKWLDFIKRTATQFSKEHRLAYNDVFTLLRDWVMKADKWSIFIPLTISTTDDKSLYQQLGEYDKAADEAWKTMQRLDKRIAQLRKKGAHKIVNEDALSFDSSRVSDDDKELTKAIKEREQAQKDYNDAISKGGESKKENTASTKAQKAAETELQKALKDELQLIEKVRSNYKELTKAGVDHASAISSAISGYDKSVANINAVLNKYGIGLDLSKFAGNNNPKAILAMLQEQLNKLIGKAKPEEIQALEIEIQKINLDVEKFDTTQITDALNRELGNIKDEYELALELDANPELGSMFAEIFGIDTDSLPQTFAEAFEKANDVAMSKLKKLKVNLDNFDLMSTVIKPDDDGLWMGLAYDSAAVQKLVNAQNDWRNLYRKNLESTEKMLDDYVKKFGDYSDKMAAIEAKRLAQMKELNNVYYTEEMRKSQDYTTKLNAINAGAESDKGQVKWDEFKNSALYITMFENLEYASTKTLEAIHQKLEELKGDWKQLTPEQLKTITDKYLQIETQLSKRNPFKGLIKNAKEYAKAVGSTGKQAQDRFKTAQKQYDEEKEVVATLKKQKVALESANQTKTEQYRIVVDSLALEETELETRKKELVAAQKLVEKYDLMRKIFKSQTSSVATMLNIVSSNLQGLGEFRDTLNSLFGVDGSKGETVLGHNLDGVIDGLSKAGQAMSSIVSSATSGNVFGVLSGTVNLFAGIGDSISSIFGGGAAKTRKLNREINDSVEVVRKLSLAYKDLERAVETEMGSAELQARRQEIANKEAQLRELQRQKQLESEKRSKDRDDDRIKELESSIKDLQIELAEMADEIAATLLGSKVKDAAEEFVSTWVDAWRAGEDTMAAMESKFDDMIDNLIMKSVASRVVANHLQQIWDTVDAITKESSEGGTSITMNELDRIKSLIGDKSIREAINDDLKALYTALGIAYGSDAEKSLSALQQGISGITEDQAGALEAYWNINTQQQFVHTDLLTQIRDTLTGLEFDVQTETMSQILLQLRSSYEIQAAIHSLLSGWSADNERAVRVELIS